MQRFDEMASPAVRFCIEREKFLQAYTTAALRYTRLHSERIFAVIKEVESPSWAELVEAEIQKDNAKITLLTHQKEHGC
jgi:hypothetical protein